MKIENLKIKENISFEDKVMAIDYIVGRLFEFDEDGFVINYSPYYMEPAQIEAIVTFFLEGIELDDGEIIYDVVSKNTEVSNLINSFFISSKRKTVLTYPQQVMKFVTGCVEEKLTFMKQLYLNQILTRKDSFALFLDNFSKKIQEIDFSKFSTIDYESIAKYIQSMNDLGKKLTVYPNDSEHNIVSIAKNS